MASKLSDICGYAKGKTAVAGLTNQTYISTENMIPNKGGITTATTLPSSEYTQAYIKDDVLVSNIRPYFKKIWSAECDGGCSNDVLVFRAVEGVDPTFLYYVLADDNFFNYAMATSKGTKMPRGDKSAIMEYVVPDFDIETQRKIGTLLRDIDQKIMVNCKINDNLQQQLATVYKSWYQDFSQATDTDLIETTYGLIPKGYRYVLLGDLCQSVSVTHKFNKEKLIFLNTGDIENGHFLHSNFMSVKEMPGQAKKTIAPRDILYSEIRPINRHFAYVNFPSDDYVVSTKLMVIRSKGIDSRRLYNYLTSEEIINELQHQAETRSGTFPQIRFDNVSRLPILIADDKTERFFIELLHTVYDQIEHINSENKRLVAIRDALLPKLMSGEIDVSDIQL